MWSFQTFSFNGIVPSEQMNKCYIINEAHVQSYTPNTHLALPPSQLKKKPKNLKRRKKRLQTNEWASCCLSFNSSLVSLNKFYKMVEHFSLHSKQSVGWRYTFQQIAEGYNIARPWKYNLQRSFNQFQFTSTISSNFVNLNFRS